MAFKTQLLSALAVISVLLLQSAQSLDLEGAKERPCFEVSKTAKTDLQWLMSVKKWYYPLGSRFDIYAFGADLLDKDPKDVNEYDLYYKSCLSWQFGADGSSLVATGFGKKKSYNIKPLTEDMGTIEISSPDGDESMKGVGYTTFTDNKSFIFYVTCYTGLNQAVWLAASPYKSLPKKTIKLIHDHARSHGFKDEYFTGFRYESCDKDEEDRQKEKNEL